MGGGTHLAFGLAVSLTAVGLAGFGLGPDVAWQHLAVSWVRHGSLQLPELPPLDWPALILAGGLGSLLPDIDQPGSLVTRLPERQGRAMRRLARRDGWIQVPDGPLLGTLLAAMGALVSALLGGTSRRRSAGRFLALVLALAFATLAVLARWLPPSSLLAWPVQWRQTAALFCGIAALGAVLVAAGGVAGLVHRLPGHHRGWTHAPPLAVALGVAAVLLGSAFLPAWPGVGPAFAAGYGSHLAADALTIRGIPLWWPSTSQPSLHLLPRRLRVRTGSGGETAFNICWVAAWPLVLLAVIYWIG